MTELRLDPNQVPVYFSYSGPGLSRGLLFTVILFSVATVLTPTTVAFRATQAFRPYWNKVQSLLHQ